MNCTILLLYNIIVYECVGLFDWNVPLNMSSFLIAAVEKHNNTVQRRRWGHLSAGRWVGGWDGCGRVHMARFWSTTACLTAPSTLGDEPVLLRACVCLFLPPHHSPLTRTQPTPRSQARTKWVCAHKQPASVCQRRSARRTYAPERPVAPSDGRP